jgi:hypothetical protein
MNIEPLKMWDDQCVEGLRQDWQVPMLTVFDLVSSTNDIALAQAGRGAPVGGVVLANHQSRGRGQHGRRWHSHEGKGLLMSLILSPGSASHTDLQEHAALAVAATLQEMLGSDLMMKPPNDLLSRRRRKMAGVLVESSTDDRVVLGIGISVLQDPNDWPPEFTRVSGLSPHAWLQRQAPRDRRCLDSTLAHRDQIAPPTINIDRADSDNHLDLVPHQARPNRDASRDDQFIGFGGTNVSLIFKRVLP